MMDYTQDRLRKSIDTACEMGYRGLRFATSRDENDPVWGHCRTHRSSDGAKRVGVCPAWDDKTMSCMLDKQEVLFRKKR